MGLYASLPEPCVHEAESQSVTEHCSVKQGRALAKKLLGSRPGAGPPIPLRPGRNPHAGEKIRSPGMTPSLPVRASESESRPGRLNREPDSDCRQPLPRRRPSQAGLRLGCPLRDAVRGRPVCNQRRCHATASSELRPTTARRSRDPETRGGSGRGTAAYHLVPPPPLHALSAGRAGRGGGVRGSRSGRGPRR